MHIQNISKRIYGQTFLFECGNFPGEYGTECAKSVLKSLRKSNYSGTLHYYTGHVPAWSTNWVVGIVLEKEYPYEFWKGIKTSVKEAVPDKIDFYCMEAATGAAMEQSLMMIAHLYLEQGLIRECQEGEDGESDVCDYFDNLAKAIEGRYFP